MKKYILYIFSASLIVLLGCNRDDDRKHDSNQEIKLNVSVNKTLIVKSIGPVTSQFTTDFPIGIFAHNGTYTSKGSADMEALSAADQTAGVEITTAGVDANSPVMTVPLAAGLPYNLTMVVQPLNSATTVSYTTALTTTAEMGK